MRIFKSLRKDTRGIAAVELGMVLGMISLAVIGGISGLGTGVTDSYNDTAQKVAAATP